MTRLKQQIAFIKEIDQLKYITRKTKLFASNRHENDAEHSWHLALMTLILAEHANEEIDVLKVLKMVLIHDLVEIDAGDIFLFDTTKNHNNTEEELRAATRIFSILPRDQALELISLWKEFEYGQTKEAAFAKAIDRLQPVLQNESNDGGSWVEYSVPYDTIYAKIEHMNTGSTTLWNYVEALLNTMKKKEILCQ
ncbi:HD family hydrolase [Aquimarina hainanensis]|uniref:5'-deoxynucleotidase n=1 Tax=Aquimarina hainanensis TaxID=1578017 RepID=A0ABW5ND56_9FLAO|nr:HD domain-containing protein [Aquimarina sp. TRL1]QKX06724.1 HD domain-containing protein [Aquimarina sp. TRL1]